MSIKSEIRFFLIAGLGTYVVLAICKALGLFSSSHVDFFGYEGLAFFVATCLFGFRLGIAYGKGQIPKVEPMVEPKC